MKFSNVKWVNYLCLVKDLLHLDDFLYVEKMKVLMNNITYTQSSLSLLLNLHVHSHFHGTLTLTGFLQNVLPILRAYIGLYMWFCQMHVYSCWVQEPELWLFHNVHMQIQASKYWIRYVREGTTYDLSNTNVIGTQPFTNFYINATN